MTSNTTGVGTGLERGVDVTGSQMDDRQTGRRKSAFAMRKPSVAVDEAPVAIVEAHTLNDADRQLAEMGYVQVSSILKLGQHLLTFSPSLGIQARILLAVNRVLRPLNLWPLRQRLNHLRLPF